MYMDNTPGIGTYVIERGSKKTLFGGIEYTRDYQCNDLNGNKLLDIKKKLAEDQFVISDTSGKLFGEIHKQFIEIVPTYNLLDEKKAIVGKMKEDLSISDIVTMDLAKNLFRPHKFLLEDANKKVIAIATLTVPSPEDILNSLLNLASAMKNNKQSNLNEIFGPMGYSVEGNALYSKFGFDITNEDSSIVFANVKIGQSSFYLQYTQKFNPGSWANAFTSYKLNIVNDTIPFKLLLEFVISIDHLFGAYGFQNNANSQNGNNVFGGGGTPPGIKIGF